MTDTDDDLRLSDEDRQKGRAHVSELRRRLASTRNEQGVLDDGDPKENEERE